jgi:hypothetical protein
MLVEEPPAVISAIAPPDAAKRATSTRAKGGRRPIENIVEGAAWVAAPSTRGPSSQQHGSRAAKHRVF